METVQKNIRSPVGVLEVTLRGEKIGGLSFLGSNSHLPESRAMDPHHQTTFSFLRNWLDAYFNKKNRSPFPWDLLDFDEGTDFEKTVWRELWKIPFGNVVSYQAIAARIGKPLGSRAVGQANGLNPIPLLIPCHRVIAADGSLGGFSSGVSLKKKLLAHEGFPGDSFFMSEAVRQARKAAACGEIPVGAVMTRDGEIIVRTFNRREKTGSPLDHAEMILLRSASKKLKSWRLTGCTLYVTLEPCPMCLGALLQARVSRLVFGCTDPKRTEKKKSTFPSLATKAVVQGNNHSMAVSGGVFEEKCRQLLKDFFREKRR